MRLISPKNQHVHPGRDGVRLFKRNPGEKWPVECGRIPASCQSNTLQYSYTADRGHRAMGYPIDCASCIYVGFIFKTGPLNLTGRPPTENTSQLIIMSSTPRPHQRLPPPLPLLAAAAAAAASILCLAFCSCSSLAWAFSRCLTVLCTV